MDRRTVLAGIGTLLTGCTAIDDSTTPTASRTSQTPTQTSTPTPTPSHPFSEGTVSVYIDTSETTSTHDLAAVTDEALTYWTQHAVEYAGFEFSYAITGARSDADIHLQYIDTFEGTCGEDHYEDVVGCADLLTQGDSISTATAEVVVGERTRKNVLRTTKHELGHVLGLGHTDEPLVVMSNDPATALQAGELRVELEETYVAAYDASGDGISKWNDAVSSWNEERYSEAHDGFEASAAANDRAAGHLDECHGLHDKLRYTGADGYDISAVGDMLAAASNRVKYMKTAGGDMAAAAAALEINSNNQAQDRHRQADDALENADEYSIAAPYDFAVAIGMGGWVKPASDDEGG